MLQQIIISFYHLGNQAHQVPTTLGVPDQDEAPAIVFSCHVLLEAVDCVAVSEVKVRFNGIRKIEAMVYCR